MKDTKYILTNNDLYDYHRLQEKLTDYAAEGWHLEKITNLYLKFRRGEPKQVRYEIIYAAAASVYNSQPTEEEKDLEALCAEAGWELAAAIAQVQIYRTENPDAAPLETDAVQKYRNIRRNMMWHLFPQQLGAIALYTVLFLMFGSSLREKPASILSSNIMVLALATVAVFVIECSIRLGGNLLWLRKARQSVEAGQAIPSNRFYRWFRWVEWATVALYVLALLFWVEPGYGVSILILAPIMVLTSLGILAITKRLNASWKVNFWVPALAATAVILFCRPLLSDFLNPVEKPVELPLTLTHLTGEKSDGKLTIDVDSSPLVSHGRYFDFGLVNQIQYTMVDIHCPLFYDMIFNDIEYDFLCYRRYHGDTEISAELRELIGADYIRRSAGPLSDDWFICWEDRIVCIYINWPLTEEQIAILAQTLKPQ